jgi:small-conductance mechanosensitive channel/CRP-like cAMP-binding protein
MQLPLVPIALAAEQLLLVLLVIAVVSLFAKSERKTLFGILIVYLLSFLFRVAGELTMANEFPRTSKLFALLSLVFAGIALINLGATILFSVVLRALRVEPPRILRDLAIAFSYIALMLFLFSQYDVNLTGIITTSAVITAVVGFSLQDVLGNVMGGIALQLDRTYTPGDWIRFGEVNGLVREIGWRRTIVETRNGDRVAIPNSLMMRNLVTVQGKTWSGELRQRRHIFFNVPYKHSPQQVIDVVTDAITREPIQRVGREPKPNVVLMEFADGWGHYALRYWLTDLSVDDPIDSIVRTRIYYALQRAGISFALPYTEISIARREKEVDVFDTPTEQNRISALRSVPIFESLTEDEVRHVAAKLVFTPFVPGEAILVQGAAVHHLYILTEGVVEVRVSVDGGAPSPVAKMRAPNFFGEGGMLTGQPRSATIIALTNVECWRLDKEGFESILRSRPEIAEEISHVIAMRRVELAAVQENLSEEAQRQRLHAEKHDFLSRVRDFFSL